jgi:ADP-ribose pyrophosphatase YjhB (NUDIX family)
MTDVCYCIRCGAPLIQTERYGKLRPTCPQCGWVYFQDPKVAVAGLVRQNDAVLLIQRSNPPHQGKWTLPAGFVDADETPEAALMRECKEETGLEVRITGLLQLLAGKEHPRGADILLVYGLEIIGGQLVPGDDAADARFFPGQQLPELGFLSTRQILDRFWLEPGPK